MEIRYHRIFKKHFQQRIATNPNLRKRFEQRLHLFLTDPNNSRLRHHQLKGKKKDYYAFALTRDIRVVYTRVNDTVYLYDIGTHAQVY